MHITKEGFGPFSDVGLKLKSGRYGEASLNSDNEAFPDYYNQEK